MSEIFTRTFRVRWGELDASGFVNPANYLRYLIETAWDWGDAVGLGVNDSQSLDLFWVIRKTEIRLLRPLRHNDVFDFTIWLVNWQRVRGKRCFEIKLKESRPKSLVHCSRDPSPPAQGDIIRVHEKERLSRFQT